MPQFIPVLVVTPLTLLGRVLCSIDMLPETWRTVNLFNPIVYMVSEFRWSFHGTGDVAVGISLLATLAFLLLCLALVYWIHRARYRLKA